MIVISMKVPTDDCVFEDYSELCDDEEVDTSSRITRGVSNPNLLEDAEVTAFRDFVSLADQLWKVDILDYPADDEDKRKRPELYKFMFSDLECSLNRTPYYTWQGLVKLPVDFTLTPSDAELINIHGGLVCYGKSKLVSFDCSHGSCDISPFEPFARAELSRRVGDSVTPPSDLNRFIPHTSTGPKTYKAYSFAKRQLESLANQLRQLIKSK